LHLYFQVLPSSSHLSDDEEKTKEGGKILEARASLRKKRKGTTEKEGEGEHFSLHFGSSLEWESALEEDARSKIKTLALELSGLGLFRPTKEENPRKNAYST
jgi:hypothetical protein